MPSTEPLPLVSARPQIEVDGQAVDGLDQAVTELLVHLPADGMGHAELTVANWGTQADGRPGFAFGHLRLGSRLQVSWGSQASFDGEITALEERYGDGPPRLVLLAEDRLHRLARERGSRCWEALSLDDVLSQVAQGAGLQADVMVDGTARDWLQHNESLLAFVRRLLAPLDVPLRLQGGQLRARPEEADPDPLPLNAGGNATQVRLIADLAQQPFPTGAQGYDIDAGEPVQASASSLQPAPEGRTALHYLQSLGWPGEAIRPHPLPRDQAQAEQLAQGHLQRQAGRFVHGEVVCLDGTALHGGREVQLSGVSPRLTGRYRVTDCWHRFDAQQGLSTRLKLQRPDLTPGDDT